MTHTAGSAYLLKYLLAIDNKPGPVCCRVKFSSAKLSP